jgi:hypothetical protein
MKFRKRPIEVEAIEFTGRNHAEVFEFCPPAGRETMRGHTITIPTRDGKMLAAPGDWIIREPFPTGDRQFYPCKPELFRATYEPVDDAIPELPSRATHGGRMSSVEGMEKLNEEIAGRQE